MATPNLPLGARGRFLDYSMWNFIAGTWTPTRSAAGIYFNRKTAAAATTNPFVNISRAIQRVNMPSVNIPMGTEVQSGGLIVAFDLVYAVNTAALTSLTPQLYQTTMVNGAAVGTPTNPGGTLTPLGTVGANGVVTAAAAAPLGGTNANPFCVRYTLATPYVIGANQFEISDWLELAVVDAGSSVFDLYGVLPIFRG